MWYAFWAVTLAFISLAIIWYAMYRESLEETGDAKTDPVRASLKFLDGAAPPLEKSIKTSEAKKADSPPKSAPKKGPKK